MKKNNYFAVFDLSAIFGCYWRKYVDDRDSNQGPIKQLHPPSYLRTSADKNLTSEAEEDRVTHSAADFDHLPEKIRKMKPSSTLAIKDDGSNPDGHG